MRTLLLITLLGLAAACTPPGSGSTGASSATEPPGGAAEANNGEAPAVRYTNAREGYRVDAPGKMTANADGSASVTGPLERLQILVLHGSAASDPAAAAVADVAALTSGATNFRLLSGPAVATVGTLRVQKVVYSWTDGTSSVTGKPNNLVGVRYYIPKNATTLAVLSYGVTASQYDPQGADDVAMTFTWQ
ncbi:MAG TPA: hypothetical protein VGS17_11750 [Candidatus Limnocylindria bacterium]|nr:hypothetical protein [Candidatus Limnocylindria bacterium]